MSSRPSPKLSGGALLWVCHRLSDRVSRAPVPSQGLSLPSSVIPGVAVSPGSSVGPRGRTKVPMAVAWPERSSCSWRRPRRYRYSIRSTSERGRLACCRNSARTRASAPGFPRPARSSSRYRLRTCLCSRLGRLMTAWSPAAAANPPGAPPGHTVSGS
ncbi:E130208F15Rik [Phodopus roborovskii]|uniref:E130208F15Rik protein n=1 Tax=Phodopus roborovskii TaxID=109678 RepID=A0AAV0A9A4_PHORO|nr:E130208F15Rik [Phodopus roborovskii]